MSLRARLQRLERITVERGCPSCRDRRDKTVFLRAEQLPDGSVVAVEDNLQPRGRCVQVPEQIIEVIESVVGSPTGSP